MRTTGIYDVEVFKNLFCVTFLVNEEVHQFVIHKSRNDHDALCKFIESIDTMIGYNNLAYDWPLLRYIIQTNPSLPKIYKRSQELIESGKSFNDPGQLDLMRINHYDNKARLTSLKWLAINMGFENVQDMPFHYSESINQENIQIVLDYNLKDVRVTERLYQRCLGAIDLRVQMSEKYGIDMRNFSDSKMGESIVLKLLSDKMKIPVKTLKEYRTFNDNLKISECILPEVKFKTKEFQAIHEKFKQMVFNDDQKEMVAVLDNMEYYFGLGGIHAVRPAGIYSGIKSCDVTGYYPSLVVSQRFAPYHLGEDFYEVYKFIAEERSRFPKGSPENYALKISSNAVFGKGNSIYSPFYDTKFFAKITVNGQLLIAMLCERITTMGIGRIIMANTDGIEVDVYDQQRYEWLCGEWEKKFNLNLEHTTYSKILIRDVNNYLALTESGKIKEKGAFECDPELHKNRSMRIVPVAVKEWFTKGIPVEKTIREENNLDLFIMGARAKTGKLVLGDKEVPKHFRYYVSNRGLPLFKRLSKGDVSVNKGYLVTDCNRWPDSWDINKQFYIKEANKLISSVLTQTSLWE